MIKFGVDRRTDTGGAGVQQYLPLFARSIVREDGLTLV